MRLLKFSFLLILLAALSCSRKNHSHTHSVVAEHSIESNTNDYFGAYVLKDHRYGTQTEVKILRNSRLIKTNSLPNHEVGNFPNPGNPNAISAQSLTYKLPLNPKFIGHAKECRETGIALNGVKFEPGTAERVICSSGETYRVEAKQELINLGLDFNNAHVQPTGHYHYHAKPMGLVDKFDNGQDLVHIGFAMDGFPMYFSKSGKYKPSYQMNTIKRSGNNCKYIGLGGYEIDSNFNGDQPDGTYTQDWEFIEGSGDLDACNGITINNKYVYLVTEEYPYVGRCLNGEFKESRHPGPPPSGMERGGQGQGRPTGNGFGRPEMGGPPPQF